MTYTIVNGAVSYGAETVLEEINFSIFDKEKIAVVGNNGCGKTTLLKSIIDNEMLEEGIGKRKFTVVKSGRPVIGYLKQIDFKDPECTFLEEILKSYKHIIALEKKIEFLQKELQNGSDDKLISEYTDCLEEYKLNDGYTYKKEYEVAIKKFGFSEEDKAKKISEFSGGQKTKIAFLKLLLSKPDILLLDEPTNHLDIGTIEWLEGYLKNYSKSVVIVSHDRRFLDKIVNKVYEIEYASITEYKGNYTDFERQKRENYEKQLKDYEYQQKEIKRLRDIADRFRYKPTKAKMALSKLKRIEQMTIIEEPNKYDMKTFHANFNLPVESGNMVLSAENLGIGYDGVPLAEVSFKLFKGQKLAVIGENGKGKSTLLKTLMGFIPSTGGFYEYGYHVVKEYFDQQMEFKNAENTVFEDFSNEFPRLSTREIRQSLGAFLFSGEDVFKKIEVLSGGEKVRLLLCKIFKKNPNLLLLDEPTNHMDILGKESLENILKEYKGTLIVVSHDRYFVNKIADSILAFEPQGVIAFNGGYEEYREYRNTLSDNEEKSVTKHKEKKKPVNTYLLKKEVTRVKNKIKKIESDIERRENEIEQLKVKMSDEEISSDYLKLKEIQDEISQIERRIEENMTLWEELSEKVSETEKEIHAES